MRYKKIVFVSIIILSIVIILSILGPTVTGYVTYNTKVDSEISEEIDEKDVDVIVILKDEDDLNKKDFKRKRDLVGNKGFSARVNKNDLKKLALDKDVLKIDYDHKMNMHLQDSVILINASGARNLLINELNLTGKGESVCVIDTGVNYSNLDIGNCSVTSDINNGSCGKVIGGYNYCVDDDCSIENNNPMDNNGHGTHVAGIVAGSNGVAPRSSIVAIKVLNSAGIGLESDISNGIQWCVDNSTRFNISVISLSLGSDSLYGNYCDDSFESTFKVSINNAVMKNITVLASTGNSGSTTGISSPACIENATAVGWTDKSDNIVTSGNRNSLVRIMAPGSSINSSRWNKDSCLGGCSCNGDYMVCSGSSMSTPHVAGTVAIMQQYKKEESNRSLTVYDIWGNLSSGVSVGSWIRVDVVKSLKGIDNLNPLLVLDSPENKTYTNGNISLSYTSSDTNLESTWYNINDTNVSLSGNISLNLSEGNYTLLIFNNDSNGNSNMSNVSFSVNLDKPIVSLDYPNDGFNSSLNNLSFNCSASDHSNLSNISLYHNISSNFSLNQTRNLSGTVNSSSFIVENINDGNYIWNCLVYDNDSNFDFSDNRSFRIDSTEPIVSLISPGNDSNLSSSSVSFSYSVSDLSAANCSLILDGVFDQSNGGGSFSKSLSNGNYIWNVNCTDYSNLVGNSESWRFSISVVEEDSGGNSESGGSSSSSDGMTVSSDSSVDLPITTEVESEEVEVIEEVIDEKVIEENNSEKFIKETKSSWFTGQAIRNLTKSKSYLFGIGFVVVLLVLVYLRRKFII